MIAEIKNEPDNLIQFLFSDIGIMEKKEKESIKNGYIKAKRS